MRWLTLSALFFATSTSFASEPCLTEFDFVATSRTADTASGFRVMTLWIGYGLQRFIYAPDSERTQILTETRSYEFMNDAPDAVRTMFASNLRTMSESEECRVIEISDDQGHFECDSLGYFLVQSRRDELGQYMALVNLPSKDISASADYREAEELLEQLTVEAVAQASASLE